MMKYLILWLTLVALTLGHGGDSSNHDKSNTKQETSSGGMKNILLGFGLVIFGATLSTLGAMVLYLDIIIKKVSNVDANFSLAKSKPFLSSSLSFSAGVLAVTIFLNLLPEGREAFVKSGFFGKHGELVAAAYFSLCMILVMVLKRVAGHSHSHSIPPLELNEPAEPTTEPASTEKNVAIIISTHSSEDESRMRRLGYEIALAIALHNFPEGVVTFVASYKSIKGGLLFGIALALHKFPEGIMIGVPIFAGTGSKWKAAAITAGASYVTQLLGALFAYLLFKVYWNDIIAGILFLLAAAILSNTLFGGMLPLAKSYDPQDKYCTIWLLTGITLFILLTSLIRE